MERSAPTELTAFERLAVSIGRMANERPLAKKLQFKFLRTATYAWVMPAISRRLYVDNVERYATSPADRGVVVAANHRTYFDAYVYMLSLYMAGATWPDRLFFPVRSNFFYEKAAGILVNFGISGGAMYPPIFRDKSKADHNRDALDRLARFLGEEGTLVGLHPEGTRNKGDDPYALLRAQPGIGQIVLQARPLVIPVFINGMTNDFVETIRDSFRPGIRTENPVIVAFGQPVDYSEFTTSKPRAVLYKKTSDRILEAIAAAGEREREIRAAIASGEIGDDDPGWAWRR